MSELQPASNRFSVISLVYCREMRDQLRDRRTLFTILVLPLVLYPLLGSLMLQVAQFSSVQETSVCLVGANRLPVTPPLLSGEGSLHARYAEGFGPLELVLQPAESELSEELIRDKVSQWVESGVFHAAIIVGRPEDPSKISIEVLHSAVSDASRAAHGRVVQLLGRWRDDCVRARLGERGIDSALLSPVALASVDVASRTRTHSTFWSKMLPFVMLVWALTGAFYPAIDLVAGEKERGTLETLLCSPALRGEIVIGKMAAVTTFSLMTAVLNVVSMLGTSLLISRQATSLEGLVAAMQPPPASTLGWLLLALLPLSALFSALALAVASLARSSKEGQYYLMPLMMLALPLVMLPMLPGTELTVGNAVIPVSGMFLLVRTFMDGQYWAALSHLPLVVGVTGICLFLATRWAGRQFEDESVLFRGGEQWSVATWVRHLWRDRQDVASVGQAYGCAAIILVGMFVAKLVVVQTPETFADLARLIVVPQLGLLLAPALLMACVLTRSLRCSLNFHWPPWPTLPAAVLLGVCLHPSYTTLGHFIQRIYPLSPETVEAFAPFERLVNAAPLTAVILVLAVIPAICEEIAFRGFIFNGLRQKGAGARAVLVTAVLFGMSHGMLQQSLAATLMGLLLGWITLRSGSLLPALVVHAINNTLSVGLGRADQLRGAWAEYVFDFTAETTRYSVAWTLIAAGVAISCLLYFSMLPPPVRPEDDPQTAFAGDLAPATAV